MRHDLLPDTLLIGATDLQDLVDVDDFSGLHAPGTRRGGNVVFPGVRGSTYVAKVYAEYAFDVPVTISCETSAGAIPTSDHERRAQFIANLKALEAVLDVGQETLTRRLATAGGGYVEHTCSGEYAAGLAVSLLNPETGRTVLQFLNHDGCWLDGGGGTHL
jgi:hypothetical protein